MSDRIETYNYVKILLSIHEHGTNSHRELIKHQLNRLNLTFSELLDQKAHELYHLCFTYDCCQCRSINKLSYLPNARHIRPEQYFNLFQKDEKIRLYGHNQTNRNCCNFAKKSASLDQIDLSLANTIFVHCCDELLWNCCLSAKNMTFQDFLNENKHVIFHMWISDKSCRSCCNGVMPLAEGFLRKDDIDFLYQKSTNDDDPSCYFANQGISTANLAPRLSYILLQALSNEIKVSNRLRKCRNDIAHRASLTLKANDFDQMWDEISTMLLQLSYVYGGEQDVSTKLQILKTEGTAENFEILLANVQRVLVSLKHAKQSHMQL